LLVKNSYYPNKNPEFSIQSALSLSEKVRLNST